MFIGGLIGVDPYMCQVVVLTLKPLTTHTTDPVVGICMFTIMMISQLPRCMVSHLTVIYGAMVLVDGRVVYGHVFFKAVFIFKCRATLPAYLLALRRVTNHVFPAAVRYLETTAAPWELTHESTSIAMDYPHMYLHGLLCKELAPAALHCAHEWPMWFIHVLVERMLQSERLVASVYRTKQQLVARMRVSHVLVQRAVIEELFVTFRTPIRIDHHVYCPVFLQMLEQLIPHLTARMLTIILLSLMRIYMNL
jgi:hypothetical protein